MLSLSGRFEATSQHFGLFWPDFRSSYLCTTMLAVTGITNKSLRALMTGLLDSIDYTANQASFDLARLRVNGLITASQARTATAHRRRAAVRDLLHQTARPAAASPSCRRPATRPATHYETCAPSTLTSQNASTPPDCRSMQPENSRQVSMT